MCVKAREVREGKFVCGDLEGDRCVYIGGEGETLH